LLTYVFSLSVASETFPSLWKQTAVVPVFKKGSSTMISNYISVLTFNSFSKIFEFIVCDHLYCFLRTDLSFSAWLS
jgi:hypothetical protein